MGMFSRFENKAEDVIEGSGGRGRGGIEPVKLAKRACKEMEREKMVGVGHEYAPTLYNILVSPEDDAAMSGYYPSLAGEVETYLSGQGSQGGLVFDCPPLVRFIVDDGLKRGKFDVIAESVSPAIISELRHEEMIRYGIEGDFNDGADDFGYYDEPEPEPEPEPVFRHEPGPRLNPRAQQQAPRAYPPEEMPPAQPEATPFEESELEPIPQPAAERTVMLNDAIIEQPQAVLYSFQTKKHYQMRNDRTIIGRETNCDVVIPDPSVSRRHAEILHNDSGWLIRDTGSTNGLVINGVVTTQSRIYDGDIIDLGTTQLEFQEG
jgi:hypothetical protein